MHRMKRLLRLLSSILLLGTAACRKPPPPLPTEVVLSFAATVPSDPENVAWKGAPEYTAVLVPQDLVEPRQMTTTTSTVRVRAITNGSEVAFRLEWDDATRDDLPGVSRFDDACALQVPQRIETNVPAPQMGEPGRPVEIAYWNASWQAYVDGRGRSINDLYPNAAIDHYPFEARPLDESPTSQEAMATRYAPARAVGNPVADPPSTPVQDLTAEGPGTLTHASSSDSRGKGVRTDRGWAVVIVRDAIPAPAEPVQPQVAFAVWDGSAGEVGARKMRTGWIPTAMQGQP
jgi:hypothetical protein